MVAVWVVQMPIHNVVRVVAVRNGRMAAIGTVQMTLLMPATIMGRCAVGRIRCIDSKRVLFDFTTALVVQMTVVEIVDMPLMFDAGVPTTRPMLMRVSLVMSCHDLFLLPGNEVPSGMIPWRTSATRPKITKSQ